ncbi:MULTISPECIES: KTSC domain-containing protein [Halorussus]|uniref:KTSC domain-containing protein n=1 Tax=Halorussus TaxID=1070314 RepID=UPI00209C9109|nr:KTSC domain-containing protein [Halorussus vallis]USZ78087.1 KTSC domain-containing protein [Halorussus vallis]
MEAVTADGERIECDEVEEGGEGLVCFYDDRIVGYVPYDELRYVAETRVPVTSSSVRSIGYDRDDETLEIEFQSGGVYRYFDVAQETYEEFVGARSHGGYFHENLRGKYDYRRVR